MPLCWNPCSLILQTYQKIQQQKPNNKKIFNDSSKGVFLTASRPKGSLTVETALLLPFFLFGMVSIIYLGEIIRVYLNIDAALHQQARELAAYGYAADQAANALETSADGLGGLIFSSTYVKAKVVTAVGADYLENSPVKNGAAGLSFHESRLMDTGNIDLILRYQVHTPYSYLGISQFSLKHRCYVHAWVGFTDDSFAGAEQEELVYITPGGAVYHRSRQCTHIDLSIKMVRKEETTAMRNKNGGKYYSCESCGSRAMDGQGVYITDTGDRYHSSASCSRLKRSVMAVPISQIGGRRPCSRCG